MENHGKLPFVLGPILFVFKICGGYVDLGSGVTWTTRNKVHLAYCILINVFCWIDSFIFLSAFSIENVLSSKFMTMCTMAVIYLGLVLYLTISLRVSTTNLPSVLQKFEEYESKYGLEINSRRLRKRVVVVFVFLFMCSLTISFAMVFAVQADLVAQDSVIVNSWTPFQYFSDDVLIPLAIIIQIRVIIVSLFINCSIGVYAVIISFLKSEYKSVEKYVVDSIYGKGRICCEGTDFEYKTIEKARLRHAHITHLLSSSNTILQHTAAMQFGISIPVSVMILYGLIHGKAAPGDFSLLLVMILSSIVFMFYISILAGQLNGQVGMTVVICLKGHGTAILECTQFQGGENEKSMAIKYHCQY